MATRSTLHIMTNNYEGITWYDLYRHWDGYPEEAGRKLANLIKQSDDTKELLRKVLQVNTGKRFGKIDYCWELSDGDHSDKEWIYEIRPKTIKVTQKLLDTKGTEVVKFDGNYQQYRDYIAGLLKPYYKRVKEWNKKYNKKGVA